MRKTLLLAPIAQGFSAAAPPVAAGFRSTCVDSQLSVGLISVFRFDDAVDNPRRDLVSGIDFHEPDGVNDWRNT